MDLKLAPFNVTLQNNSRSILTNLMPVTSTDVYEGLTKKLNDDGLFSTTIFGRPAEERRQNTLSYVDLRTKIMHPIMYSNIEKIATFYTQICNGSKFATWNPKTFEFDESTAVDGDTGFSFFMKYFKDIKFKRNESERRNVRIDVLDKFRETGLYDFVLIIPAGIRDIEEGKDGLSQDEINEHYRNLVSLSKNIDVTFKDNKFNDGTKLLMQRNFNSIYSILFSYIKGKRGITQDKMIKRKLENGTRSVLSPIDLAVEDMRGPQAITLTNTVVGLYQTSKGTLPLVQYSFKHELITSTFVGNNLANVVNPKTLKLEQREVSAKVRDLYMTEDGVNDFLNKFENITLRGSPVKIAGGYLAMIYKDDKGFRIIKDVSLVPEGKLDKLTPLTYGELLYYIALPNINKAPIWTTRFPYTNVDSTSPARTYIKTTTEGRVMYEYDWNWNLADTTIYNEWPTGDNSWVETLIVHPSRLAAKGGDHDGDAGSGDFTTSDEAIAEVEDYLDNIDNWFIGDKVRYFGSTDTFKWVLKAMST